MSEPILRATLLSLIEGDEQLYRQLRQAGLLPSEEEALSTEHLELARVVHVLVKELEINWPGVEVVLRLRAELLATRRQMAELVALLHETHNP